MKKNLFFAHFVCKKCTFRLPDYTLILIIRRVRKMRISNILVSR
nr:MAG TPA: hypothetical protein [Caudoviricetes sp.]